MTYRASVLHDSATRSSAGLLMTDGRTPFLRFFQLIHLADLYSKLPRHIPTICIACRTKSICSAFLFADDGLSAAGLRSLLKEFE